MERHILRESYYFFFRGPGGANACTPYKLVRDASDWLHVPSSTAILCTLSKSNRVVLITWSPSGYTPVVPECPDVLSYPCLLIAAWQLVKAHGVTRNVPKIHVICYITRRVALGEYLASMAPQCLVCFVTFTRLAKTSVQSFWWKSSWSQYSNQIVEEISLGW